MKGMSENLAVFMPIVKDVANKVSNKKSKEKPTSQIEEKPVVEQKMVEDKKEEWYEPYVSLAQDFLPSIPFQVKAVVGVLIILWVMVGWLRAGSHKQQHKSLAVDQAVVSRAVYLRDIDEGLINVDYQPSYIQSDR